MHFEKKKKTVYFLIDENSDTPSGPFKSMDEVYSEIKGQVRYSGQASDFILLQLVPGKFSIGDITFTESPE